jgi:transcriptional regulator with XRE-family HTH domain
MATSKAKTIRELREARKLSTNELGRQIGVSDATIHGWESGQQEIDAGKLPRLAKALGVPLTDIPVGENRRSLDVQGYWFLLAARGNSSKGYTAKIGPVSTDGAKAWAHRPLLPEHPHADAPSILITTTSGTGATALEALDDLATQIESIMHHALWPDRLPGDPEDWAPKDPPDWYVGPGRKRR